MQNRFLLHKQNQIKLLHQATIAHRQEQEWTK